MPSQSVSLPATHGSAGWVARAGAGVVIVRPTHAIPDEPVEVAARRVGRSFLAWPVARRVAGLSETLYEGWAARTVPVLVLDPTEQRRLKRERRLSGADRFDEVWNGVYAMAPIANNEHQYLAMQLCLAIASVVKIPDEGLVFAGVNVVGVVPPSRAGND